MLAAAHAEAAAELAAKAAPVPAPAEEHAVPVGPRVIPTDDGKLTISLR
jgi:hypothetical protein